MFPSPINPPPRSNLILVNNKLAIINTLTTNTIAVSYALFPSVFLEISKHVWTGRSMCGQEGALVFHRVIELYFLSGSQLFAF